MKKIDITFLLFFGTLLIFASCSEKKEQPEMQENNKKDRNIFGYGIPRGLTKTSEGLADGYILFAIPNSPYTYLINRKGEVVHEWKGNYRISHSYLMEDGSIIQGADDPDFPVFGCCGPFGRVQKITWDNKMQWDFEYATEEHIIHHDFTILPNGNILAIANEAISYNDAMAKGRKPELTPTGGPWLEKIVEIEPQGRKGGKIVWEWHVSDHLIQDFDPSKENYGKPADHPELLDFNLGHHIPPAISQDSIDVLISKGMAHRNTTTENRGADAFHFNAIKYNPYLDQIVFSAQAINEIYIIDHSTTTKEAASHTGGRSGKGGDFLFRWGNPKNYQRGDSTNRLLFGQHDARWIEKGLPGEGHITVFNNYPPNEIDWSNMGNTGNNYSMIFELEITPDQSGNYAIEKDKTFGPEKPVWRYMAPDTLSFYSSFISGAHRMANGNTLINEGAKGRFFEVTPDGKTVWEYLNPYHGEIREPNGDPINPMFMPFSIFRATFIPANHPAFAGKELKPLDPQPKPFVLPPPPKENKKM